MASAFSTYHGGQNQADYTVTALGRWSCLNKTLPEVGQIKALHVYDFDNTLFKTPLPNPAVWNAQTIGLLSSQDAIINGGWWHDGRILSATGQGVEKEEPRAWKGWWNEKIVDLVKLSMEQPDALCVLLTGRSETSFSELIQRMVNSKQLKFDMHVLKPPVGPANQHLLNTMHFKQLFLHDLMETYLNAAEIRIYEDRPKHTQAFRDYLQEYNHTQNTKRTRKPLTAEVIQVSGASTTLDPVAEVAEVQHMINQHNDNLTKQPLHLRPNLLKIKKTVFFTSYVIGSEDSKKLLKLANIPPTVPNHALKYHGNNILICPRQCPQTLLEKVGGMGSKMTWEVTGTACYDNNIWAACVNPVPPTATFHSDNPVPLVILALKRGARPGDSGKINTWSSLPHDKRFKFESTVGERSILRVEHEDPREDEYASLFSNRGTKRKHNGDDDKLPRGSQGRGSKNPSFGSRGGAMTGRGRGSRSRGNGRGQGRGGRGRGGHFYRSLDDVEPKAQHNGRNFLGSYDDNHPASGSSHSTAATHVQGRPMGGGQAGNTTDLQNYY